MLPYLDGLCAALLARDKKEVDRLLAHPLAHRLPRRVREEAIAIRRAGRGGFRAPINALHFYYQMTHLLDASADALAHSRDGSGESPDDDGQIELPLRAAGGWR